MATAGAMAFEAAMHPNPPHISPYLPLSPVISPYLPVSPHISLYLRAFEQAHLIEPHRLTLTLSPPLPLTGARRASARLRATAHRTIESDVSDHFAVVVDLAWEM